MRLTYVFIALGLILRCIGLVILAPAAVAIYYNDSTTLFSIDKVAMETNTSRRIVKDVFSLVKKEECLPCFAKIMVLS